jgi:pimeloyl-ACP methyl ester carboxylesterase
VSTTEPAPAPVTPTTIVLIHGLWMTPRSWEHWIDRYSGRGHQVIAPAWPGMEGEVEELRRDPSPIARQTVPEILDHYERIIDKLDHPPIIMGHSFGGAFAQVLLDRGVGAAGVAIDPGPPKGVLKLPFSTIRSSWSILRNPSNKREAVAITPTQFRYAFANTLTEDESLNAYQRYAVPGSGGVLFEGAMANVKSHSPFRIDWGKADRAPLLIVGGGSDHVVPPSLSRSIFNHYSGPSTVEYKEFPGRSHYTVGQDGWEDVADAALTWAVDHATTRPG